MKEQQLIAINCRWMSQSMTGTERYAAEITRELVSSRPNAFSLIIPKSSNVPEWASKNHLVRSPFDGIFFEQVYLPLKTLGRKLLNLSGPAPIFKRNQAVVLFDASVFRYPHTFSRAFVIWYKVMYFLVSRLSRTLITISEFSASEISDVTKIPRERFVIAHCGADHAFNYEPKRPSFAVPDEFVLCIGTLSERKNLVPATKALSRAGIHTVVVGGSGSGHVFGEGGKEIDTRNLTVPGRLSDDEIAWLLDKASVLVFPSLYEGFGLPIVEAQARGCPVVSSGVSSMPEVMEGSGLLFDPTDQDELVTKVQSILLNSDTARELSLKGRRNASRFTWKKSAQRIWDAIDDSDC